MHTLHLQSHFQDVRNLNCNHVGTDSNPMESQTRVSKRAPREFRNWRVQPNPPTLCQPFANLVANPLPTLRQPFANPLPTFSANPSPNPSFCGPQAPVQRHGLTVSWTSEANAYFPGFGEEHINFFCLVNRPVVPGSTRPSPAQKFMFTCLFSS